MPSPSQAAPLPWQFDPIDIAAKAIGLRQSLLDASDTGTGKTFVALLAAKAAGKKVAVVCPKSVIPAWREAIARVGVECLFVANIEALKADGRGFLMHLGRIYYWTPPQALLIFDEVHRFSAPNTQNAKILAAAPRPVLMLSATAAGDPTKMRAIGHQLGLTTWRDWWTWCGRNGCKRGKFGGIEFHGTPEHLDSLHRQIFNTGRGVRVRIANLDGLFPQNRLETVLVPVENQKAIDAAYLEELRALEASAPNALAAGMRARQIAEHQKLPAIIELTEDLVASGNAVVVFVNFRDSLDRILRECKATHCYIHGDQTPAERQEQVELFQADEGALMVCMIQAGGVGLSLHDLHGHHPRVSLICPGWSAVELRQALGRVHRAGARSPALQKIIFAAETIEERIRRKVQIKLDRIDTLNDGDLNASLPAMKNESPVPTRPAESQSLLPGVQDAAPGGNVSLPSVSHAQRQHSRIGPSRLKGLEICPSLVEEADAEIHPVTAEGTLCHEALDSGEDTKLNEEQRAWVAMCREYVDSLVTTDDRILREERLDIVDGIWGFADLLILAGDGLAHLIDYKFGYHSQEDVATNPAAQAYVLGMFKRWPELQRVAVHYLYPRRQEVSQHVYQRSDCAKIELRIRTIVARVQAGQERHPDPEVCTWCAHKATCAELHREVLPLATRYGLRKEMEVPFPANADFSLVKDPKTWSRLMALAPVLEAMAGSIKKHAIEFREQSGQEIPGYDLRVRSGRRTINNAVLAWEVANQFISQEQFLRAVDVSAKRLAEAAGENAPKGQKSKRATELEGKLRDAGILEIGPDTFYFAKAK